MAEQAPLRRAPRAPRAPRLWAASAALLAFCAVPSFARGVFRRLEAREAGTRAGPAVLGASGAAPGPLGRAEVHAVESLCAVYTCSDQYVPSNPCQCNRECASHRSCCPDYTAVCEKPPAAPPPALPAAPKPAAPPPAQPVVPKPEQAAPAPPPSGEKSWKVKGGFMCREGELPSVFDHSSASGAAPLDVSVMSYNLYWWVLFDKGKPGDQKPYKETNGNTGTELIAQSTKDHDFDAIGFQECGDEKWLLNHSRLSDRYGVFRDRACCMAYQKQRWSLLSKGVYYVAIDDFGPRPAQWMRLKHKKTGQIMFVMNHHGPVPIDSGGRCGSASTAYLLLRTVARNALQGDAVVMLGDFNAFEGKPLFQMLSQRLHKAIGVAEDAVFTNMGPGAVASAEDLGKGGSDHSALGVTLRLPGSVAAPKAAEAEKPKAATSTPPKGEAKPPPCDSQEAATDLVMDASAGRMHVEGLEDPTGCCRRCGGIPKCRAWTFTPRLSGAGSPSRCWLWGSLPNSRSSNAAYTSGVLRP